MIDENELAFAEGENALTIEQLTKLNEFISLASLAQKFDFYGWSHDEEIHTLVRLAKQDENLNVQLRATQYIREITKDALAAAGLLVHATKTSKDEAGNITTFSTDLVASALKPKAVISDKPDKSDEGEQKDADRNTESRTTDGGDRTEESKGDGRTCKTDSGSQPSKEFRQSSGDKERPDGSTEADEQSKEGGGQLEGTAGEEAGEGTNREETDRGSRKDEAGGVEATTGDQGAGRERERADDYRRPDLASQHLLPGISAFKKQS